MKSFSLIAFAMVSRYCNAISHVGIDVSKPGEIILATTDGHQSGYMVSHQSFPSCVMVDCKRGTLHVPQTKELCRGTSTSFLHENEEYCAVLNDAIHLIGIDHDELEVGEPISTTSIGATVKFDEESGDTIFEVEGRTFAVRRVVSLFFSTLTKSERLPKQATATLMMPHHFLLEQRDALIQILTETKNKAIKVVEVLRYNTCHLDSALSNDETHRETKLYPCDQKLIGTAHEEVKRSGDIEERLDRVSLDWAVFKRASVVNDEKPPKRESQKSLKTQKRRHDDQSRISSQNSNKDAPSSAVLSDSAPTAIPTNVPALLTPSKSPSTVPVKFPSSAPTNIPIGNPSSVPSNAPAILPSLSPSSLPSSTQSEYGEASYESVQIRESERQSQRLESAYWFVSSTTVGYGDVRPPSRYPIFIPSFAPTTIPTETRRHKKNSFGFAKTHRSRRGILTAGEWSDLHSFRFWKSLVNCKGTQPQCWKHIQQKWGLCTANPIHVHVINEDKSPSSISDLSVKVFSDSNLSIIGIGRTNVTGWTTIFLQMDDERCEWKRAFKDVITVQVNRKIIGNFNVSQIKIDEKSGVPIVEVITKKTKKKRLKRKNTVDLMFVTDATGSMNDEIAFLQSDLSNLIQNVSRICSGDSMTVRTSVNFYRDLEDEYVVKSFPFDDNMEKNMKRVRAQSAAGGGDFPEAVEIALDDAIFAHKWSKNGRVRLMFLILDAPPRKGKEINASLMRSLQHAQKIGVRIIPITGSGINKETEFLMRSFAVLTGGTYIHLTDDSGVGLKHLKTETTIPKHDVGVLFDMLVKVVGSYLHCYEASGAVGFMAHF